ncbi:MAG TPA: glycosyltransferase [Terriglobales bacterium]|nr:glycosyltransferase [Terriglobales bacterium]
MHLFLNASAADSASGLTYLRNVLPRLSASGNLHTTLLVKWRFRDEFADLPRVFILDAEIPNHPARRFLFEQTAMPKLIRRSGADVLVSAGNFALRKSPVPQILLSGNSLYTSGDFSRDLRARREYRLWLDTRLKGFLALRSMRWADCTLAPSRAFAAELEGAAARYVSGVYHGFDPRIFFADSQPLSREVQQKLDAGCGALRLLFVSHYNYYRNFETLLRSIPLLRDRLHPQKVRAYLTCSFRRERNPGCHRTEAAAALVKRLSISEELVELGPIPYRQVHQVYKQCDIYVTPAYAETFAHPLVEAMATGLPIVASDLPVHQEICERAAIYFHRFSPEDLCERVFEIHQSPELKQQLASRALMRSQQFSWDEHVKQVVDIASHMLAKPKESARFHRSKLSLGARLL